MDENKIHSRNSFIDFLRGIAIFLVLWGHSIQKLSQGSNIDFFNDKIFIWIYSFHMPLFMFLSGYVFYWTCLKHNFHEIFVARLKGIGIPIMTWGTLDLILSFRHQIPTSFFSLINVWIHQIIGVWFLWAVLVISIALAGFIKLKNRILKLIALPILLAVITILPGRVNNLFMLPYFVLGYIFCKNKIFEHSFYNKIKWLAVVVWVIMLCLFKKKYYIYTSGILLLHSQYGVYEQVKIDMFRYIIGFVGVIAVIEICRVIYQVIQKKRFINMTLYAGVHSLDLYTMQRVFLETIIGSVFGHVVQNHGNILVKNMVIYDIGITVICAILCYCILIVASKILHKSDVLSLILFGR